MARLPLPFYRVPRGPAQQPDRGPEPDSLTPAQAPVFWAEARAPLPPEKQPADQQRPHRTVP